MKILSNIFKSGVAVAIAAVVGYGCGERPASNPTDDTSTSAAIVEQTDAEHLMEPRPSTIGDSAETGEQADQFGNMRSNVDTAARRLHQQNMERQLKENPNQRPIPTTPPNRTIDGQ